MKILLLFNRKMLEYLKKNIHSEYFLGHCVVSVRLQFTLYMFMQRKLIAMTHEVAYT